MRGEVVTFPQVYAGIETARLLDAYAHGPERIRRALHGLDDEQLRARPIRDKWSAFEIGLHVADSELVGAVRMRMVLGAGSEPTLPLYDQDRWCRELRYQDADATELDGALDLLAGLRATTLPLLTAASADDWT
ncbi:MAG: DinB family protein, partial [Gemmatimonadota bacterium]